MVCYNKFGWVWLGLVGFGWVWFGWVKLGFIDFYQKR